MEVNDEDRAEVAVMVDDLYKLDYEDIVAGEWVGLRVLLLSFDVI